MDAKRQSLLVVQQGARTVRAMHQNLLMHGRSASDTPAIRREELALAQALDVHAGHIRAASYPANGASSVAEIDQASRMTEAAVEAMLASC